MLMKIRIASLVVATAFAGTSLLARQAGTSAPAQGATPGAAGASAGAAQIPPTPGAQGRGGPQPSPFSTPPLRVFIYAGLKTHSEGQHDYPQFLADWSKLLMNRNALVDGGLHFPSAKELGATDVLIVYKGDAGYMSMEDRANLDAYVRRGGGLVSLHDALCGPDPADFATLVGGGKKHGEVNYTLEADIDYTIVDTTHPIMQGMTNFKLQDEAFYSMTWAKSPEVHVLATSPIAATPSAKGSGHAGEVVPQIWTYEKQMGPALAGAPTGQAFRAFVWMQGHNYANFSNPQVQGMLLRGIAWAGNRSADTLMTERPARARGGRGTAPTAAQAPGRGQ
jgi:type 1 glutamine amidotransferase